MQQYDGDLRCEAMAADLTEADFDRISWHDCYLHGFEFLTCDPDVGDWTSDLALDIDYVVDAYSDDRSRTRFRVAPATLTFRNVTDLDISIAWGDSDYRSAIHPLSIHDVEREEVVRHQVRLEQPYFAWTIRLNWPDGGRIRFGAIGFQQHLRADPIETDRHYLTSVTRKG